MEYQTTYHQKRLWFIDTFEKGQVYDTAPVYHNLPIILELSERPDIARLEQSIEEVFRSRQVLQTRVHTKEQLPEAVLDANALPALQIHNLSSDDSHLDPLGFCLQLAQRPFDLAKEVLLRFDLVCTTTNRFFFVITAHHIICDRYSLQLLADLVWTQYREGAVPEESLGFFDFSDWQNSLGEEDLEPFLFYWKQKLDDVGTFHFETDFPREHVHIYEAARQQATLSSDVSQKVQAFCQQHKIEVQQFFLSIFQLLLYKYTSSEKLVIGTFHNNRLQEELQQTIGPLANLIVLRNDISAKDSFHQLVEQVVEGHEEAVDFGAIPFEKLVLELNPQKDMSRTALFDILFQFEEEHTSSADWKLQETNSGLGKYDLNLLVKSGKDIQLYLTYNAKYFDRDRMGRLLLHFEELTSKVLETPDAALCELELLTPAEREQIIAQATAHRQVQSSNQSLVQRFEAQVDRHPNRLAVTCDDRQLTYRELDELSNQLAHYLMGRHSLQAEDICAILLDRSEWMCTAIFAVLKTAGAYLPIDPQYPEDRIAFMQEECQCKCCIDQDLINDFLSVRQQQPRHRPSLPVSSSQLAYVLFTSGSTGRPKGVLIEQKNVLSLLEAADQLGFDFTESDVWTLFHSYCFDFSVWEIYGALLHGGQLLIVPSETAKDPAAFWQLLLDKQVTVLNQTPSAFRHLTREALEQNTSSTTLRYVIFGGEALQPQQLQDWHQKYPQTELINMYGITETTVHVTFKKIGAEEIAAIVSNIGQAIPGWYGLLMDVDGRILPAGSTGELYVGGAGLARAYLNQAELTEERFILHPYVAGQKLYRTGDRVRQLPNGDFAYLGRMDDQVKIRGFRIELGEISKMLCTHPLVGEAVVVVSEQEGDNQSLVAYFVAEQELSADSLKSHLSKLLPQFMLPVFYIQVDHFPLTSNGKLDKKNLPDPLMSVLVKRADQVLPQNDTEQQLLDIWSEVLAVGPNHISTTDNFFEIGGNSLSVVKLLSKINELTEEHTRISIARLFSHTSIQQQALLLAEEPVVEEVGVKELNEINF